MQRLKGIEVQLKAEPNGQISLTDPDARSMKTRGTGSSATTYKRPSTRSTI
jgi:hypothetical protein